jgi:hypothetical protein
MNTSITRKWWKEARVYSQYYYCEYEVGQKNEQCKNIHEALDIAEKKLDNILLPLIKPLNDIVKSYLSIVDIIDEMNIPKYKLFGDMSRLILFNCFRVLYYLNNDNFYKPAILLIPDKLKDDLFELELTHAFTEYKILELISPHYIVMNIYCNNKLKKSLDSNFKDTILSVKNQYKQTNIKFFTKSSKIMLVLGCIQK